MRKTVSLMLAICGTLLLLLLFATGRLIYTHVYSQDFSDIAETGPQSTITLTENDVEVPQTDDNQKTAIIQLLSEQTYTAYPAARLTLRHPEMLVAHLGNYGELVLRVLADAAAENPAFTLNVQ